jgi:hypothetical protein
VLGARHDPDRDTDGGSVLGARLERAGDPLGEDRGARRRLLRREHAELVAADADGGVDRAQVRPQRLRDRDQRRVARGVAARVVQPLEPVDVEQQQRERVAIAPVLVLERAQPLAQEADVVEAREVVGVREPLELLRAPRHELLDGLGLERAERRGEPLDADAEQVRVVADLAAHVGDRERLEGADVRDEVRRRAARRVPQLGERRRAGDALGRQRAGAGVLRRGREVEHGGEDRRRLARDPIGRQLGDLVDARALEHPDEPGLRQLVAARVQALERWAQRGR